MLIDVHSHTLPPPAMDYLLSHQEAFGTELIHLGSKTFLRFSSGGMHPVTKAFTDMDVRLKDMAERGVDKSVISVSPALFYYDAPAEAAKRLAEICNDYAYEMVQRYPKQLEAMATVPMQDMGMALTELERARRMGMQAVEIAAIVPGIMPDDPYMDPFFEYCQRENILIFLHPTFTGTEPPYDKYYNMNLIGYVQETNWAANRLIFGGVFERFPNLHILLCHGGGLFPYQFGRLVHGWQVRPEAKQNCPRSPESYLKNLFYDTVTHWDKALAFLAENFGADQIIAGTDYPYDMADDHLAATLAALSLDDVQIEKIGAKNYLGLVGKQG